MRHNKELVAIIRKIVADDRDTEFLADMALMACYEIERLSRELETYTYNPYIHTSRSLWK